VLRGELLIYGLKTVKLEHNDRHQPLVGWMELVMRFYKEFGAPTMEVHWTVWIAGDTDTKYRLLSRPL
jgi:hypothetical protein